MTVCVHKLNNKHYILHYYKVYDAMHNHSAKRCLKGAPLLKFMNKKGVKRFPKIKIDTLS